MSVPTPPRGDPPHTRERRRAILAQAPLTAPLSPDHAARLLAASSLTTCAGGTKLFTAGEPAASIFLLGSGIVQMRVGNGGFAGAGEPTMHLRLCRAGEVVADREMAWLAAGTVGKRRRHQAAIVLGDPAEIVAIDQAVLAQVLAEDEGARARMADAVGSMIDALERLTDELAGLKNLGRVRLARLLLEFFDAMGRLRGELVGLPHLFSHADIAAALGLTRRSVFDDMLALEEFGAIDHDRAGHLVLHDRARLARIASLEPTEDRESGAAAWLADVEAALAANDTLRGLELAREALLYHPRDGELRYQAVLAALRSGAWEEAEKLIAAYRFSTVDEDERVAGLVGRVLKERAFAARTREEMRAYARQSAETYHAAHRRSEGDYSALNAAAMYCAGDRPEAGFALARRLVGGPVAYGAGYWAYATRAEAFWLLDKAQDATEMLSRAAAATDADDGKIGTTRLQLQRLSASLNRDASALIAALPVKRILVCTSPPGEACRGLGDRRQWAGVFMAITDVAEVTDRDPSDGFAEVEFVLAAPAEALLRRAPPRAVQALSRCVCHLADTAPGPVSQARREAAWRRAAGLGQLAALERGREAVLLAPTGGVCTDWPDWAAPDALAGGQSAILWVQATGDALAAGFADGVAAEARCHAANAMTLRFASVTGALAAGTVLQDLALRSGADIRLCLDVENVSAITLEAARLPRVQPLTRAGEISATEAAAAELALLRRPGIRLMAVGRVRSQRRLNRTAAWVVKQSGDWW